MTTTISLSAIAVGQPGFMECNVKIDDVNIHYKIGGEGPHLLMLHGFTLSGRQWLPYAKELAKDHTVVVADLPFHGGSGPLDGPFSYEKTARLMEGLVKRLGVSKVKGIGHNAGAITLLYMAAQSPEILESMVLVSGAHRFSEQARSLLVNDRFEHVDDDLKEYYRAIHPGGDHQIETVFNVENDFAAQFPSSITKADLNWTVLQGIRVPTMLVWGDRDKYFPIDVALELYLAMPETRLWVIPGQGHVSLWPEWGGDEGASELFAPVVRQFFEEPLPEEKVNRLATDYVQN